jgi:hypothetical protein
VENTTCLNQTARNNRQNRNARTIALVVFAQAVQDPRLRLVHPVLRTDSMRFGSVPGYGPPIKKADIGAIPGSSRRAPSWPSSGHAGRRLVEGVITGTPAVGTVARATGAAAAKPAPAARRREMTWKTVCTSPTTPLQACR